VEEFLLARGHTVHASNDSEHLPLSHRKINYEAFIELLKSKPKSVWLPFLSFFLPLLLLPPSSPSSVVPLLPLLPD
jgi:hypothetical protein